MLSLTQNLLVAVLVMALFKRLWTAHERYDRQDLLGWQLNILATTHAIIAGFMFDTEWPNFSVVKLNVEWEGSPTARRVRPRRGPAGASADAAAGAVAPQRAHQYREDLERHSQPAVPPDRA